MTSNISELRREAYRLWGIGNQPVIFDFPENQRYVENGFHFKLDFGADKASWPRAYAIAENAEDSPMVRVMLPIKLIRKYNTFSLESKGWYDMPIKVHEQLLRIVNESEIHRQLPIWRRMWNKLIPHKYRKATQVNVEDYTYVVARYNEEILVWAY